MKKFNMKILFDNGIHDSLLSVDEHLYDSELFLSKYVYLVCKMSKKNMLLLTYMYVKEKNSNNFTI